MTLGMPLGSRRLRESSSNGSFMDLRDDSPSGRWECGWTRTGQGQGRARGFNKVIRGQEREGSQISGHRIPLHSRLFPASHRVESPGRNVSYLEPFNSPTSIYSTHTFPQNRSTTVVQPASGSNTSPVISAPFGLSIASYRPIPTNTTLQQVTQSMQAPAPDLQYLDLTNTVLIPAGKSDMQRQVEELEQKRMRSQSQSHSQLDLLDGRTPGPGAGQVQGESMSPRRELAELVKRTTAPSLLPLVPDRRTRQEQRDEEEEPVNWMQTGLPRPTATSPMAGSKAPGLRWEPRNACEQLVLPRPRLQAHVITPPGSPEKAPQGGAVIRNASVKMNKGKERMVERDDQVIVIGRTGKELALFDRLDPPSPALSGPRVMLEAEEGRREREDWVRRVNKGLKVGRRGRSGSAGSALRTPVYFVDEDEISRQGGWNHAKGVQRPTENVFAPQTPPVGKSFGFLHSGSMRSKSRTTASPGRLLAVSSREQESTPGAMLSRRTSFDDQNRHFGSLGRSADDPLAAGVIRTPSHAQKRMSRNHSSPDLRKVFAGETDDIVIMKGSRYRDLIAGNNSKALPPVPAAEQLERSPYITLAPEDTVVDLTPVDLTPVLDHVVASASPVRADQEGSTTYGYHNRNGSDPYNQSSLHRPGRVAVRHPILHNSTRSPVSRHAAYVEPRAEPPHPDSPSSPNFEKLDSQTAMALAARLHSSPRRKKTSIEEAVARARTSYQVDAPSTAGLTEPGSPLRPPHPISEGHTRILSAAGILPTVHEPIESVLMEKTPSGREVLSEAAVLALASPHSFKPDEPPTPSVHLLLPVDPSTAVPSPAETVSPYQSGPMDELGDNEQDLFYARPRDAWSKPLDFPSPSKHQYHQSPLTARSVHDFPISRTIEIVSLRASNRASKDSGISLPMSSPASMDSGRAFSSTEGVSAENAVIEIATPLLSSGLRSSFPEAVTREQVEDGYEVNHYNNVDAASSSSPSAVVEGRVNLDMFQSSPALTHNGSEEQYDYLSSPGRSLKKRSSENNSLRVRSVSSGFPNQNRFSPMNLSPSRSYNDLRNRASVTPMIVNGSGSGSGADSDNTPPLLAPEGKDVLSLSANTTPEKHLLRASGGSDRTPSPATRLFQAHYLSAGTGETRSGTSTPVDNSGSHTSMESTTFAIPEFPNPPGSTPLEQRENGVSMSEPQCQQRDSGLGYKAELFRYGGGGGLIPRPMQRMDTNETMMTRDTFMTAREGSEEEQE